MNNYIWYILLLLNILLSACTNHFDNPIKHFDGKPVKRLYPTNITNLEEFGILRPVLFTQIDSNNFIFHDLRNENIFKLVNLSSKKAISGVNKGQGPNDVLAPSCLIYRNNQILVWDAMQKRMNEILLLSDSVLTINEAYRIDTEVIILYKVHLLDSTFIVTGKFDDYWLAEMNKDGTIRATIDYPIRKETKDIPKTALPQLYSSSARIASSPNNNKIVVTIGRQGLISLINNTKTGIKEYKQIKYHAPKFTVFGEMVSTSALTKDNIEGFWAVDCDDKYVYTIYSGRSFNTHQMLFHQCEHLLVYDWEGNPVKRYILDIPLFNSISYNKEKNCIYGIAENPEGVLVEYQL